MGTGVELLPVLLGAAGATAASALLAPKTPSPTITPPEKPPQAKKAPDRSSLGSANAAMAAPGGSLSGNSSTFLTGPSGVDSSTLNLGKNTLLGQ